MNILLNDTQREKYNGTISEMTKICPELIARKIPEANVQQAFVYDQVMQLSIAGDRILCIGCFEDSAYESLLKTGWNLMAIDPLSNITRQNFTLNSFFNAYQNRNYNIIFSTSVIEHVEDDEQFIDQICKLLAPGGTAILTCDFKEGWKPGDDKPGEDYRLYTKHDLLGRLHKILTANDCSLVGDIDYEGEPDFTYGIHKYSFATYVFRKEK